VKGINWRHAFEALVDDATLNPPDFLDSGRDNEDWEKIGIFLNNSFGLEISLIEKDMCLLTRIVLYSVTIICISMDLFRFSSFIYSTF
jgi:hypothetical protein